MFEGTENPREESESEERLARESSQPDPGHPVAGEDVGTPEEGAGSAKAGATPKIAEDAEMGQTTAPAPDDDVGVPDDPGNEKE